MRKTNKINSSLQLNNMTIEVEILLCVTEPKKRQILQKYLSSIKNIKTYLKTAIAIKHLTTYFLQATNHATFSFVVV